jgi:hypothetical protein
VHRIARHSDDRTGLGEIDLYDAAALSLLLCQQGVAERWRFAQRLDLGIVREGR